MTNSAITDKFIQIADGLLEQRIDDLAQRFGSSEDNFSEALASHKQSLYVAYIGDVRALNTAGKVLAEDGLDYNPINHQTTFRKAWARLGSQANCTRLVNRYEPD